MSMPKQPNLPLEKTLPNPTWYTLRKPGLFVALIAIVVDYLSKAIVLSKISALPAVIIPNLFNFTFAWNRGISFSFFSNSQTPWHIFGLTIPADVYLPATLGLVAIIAIAIFVHLLGSEKTWAGQTGTGLIIGGATGNLIDRLQHGAVVDFLHVYYQNWHFPAFNAADTAITIGVMLLIYDSIGHNKNHNNKTQKIHEK